MDLVSGLRIIFFWLIKNRHANTHVHTQTLRAVTLRPYACCSDGPRLYTANGTDSLKGGGGGGGGGGASLLVYSTHTPSALHADWHVTYVLTRTIWCSQSPDNVCACVCVFVCLFKLWQFSLRSIISYTDTDTDEWKITQAKLYVDKTCIYPLFRQECHCRRCLTRV